MSNKSRTNKMTGCDALSDLSKDAFPVPKTSKSQVIDPMRTRSANCTKEGSSKKMNPNEIEHNKNKTKLVSYPANVHAQNLIETVTFTAIKEKSFAHKNGDEKQTS